MERDAHFQSFYTYPPGSPAREPFLHFPFTQIPEREKPHLQNPFQPSLKVLGR
jgi:hypothetical protein